MFNLGPMELAVVGVVAVMLFGKKLPEVMRSLGKSYNEFRKGLTDIQSSINYSDLTSTTAYSSTKHYEPDDYDEPVAPKFEPPTAPTATDPTSESNSPATANSMPDEKPFA
jgi:sec-independent protein translocase protein TatA